MNEVQTQKPLETTSSTAEPVDQLRAEQLRIRPHSRGLEIFPHPLLRQWVESLRGALEQGRLSYGTLKLKVQTVTNFYRWLAQALPYSEAKEVEALSVARSVDRSVDRSATRSATRSGADSPEATICEKLHRDPTAAANQYLQSLRSLGHRTKLTLACNLRAHIEWLRQQGHCSAAPEDVQLNPERHFSFPFLELWTASGKAPTHGPQLIKQLASCAEVKLGLKVDPAAEQAAWERIQAERANLRSGTWPQLPDAPKTITEAILRDSEVTVAWLIQDLCARSGAGMETIKHPLSSLRSFFKWAAAEGLCRYDHKCINNPFSQFDLPLLNVVQLWLESEPNQATRLNKSYYLRTFMAHRAKHCGLEYDPLAEALSFKDFCRQKKSEHKSLTNLLLQATEADVKAYGTGLRTTGCAAAEVSRQIWAVRDFCRWSRRSDPLQPIPSPAAVSEKPLVKPPSAHSTKGRSSPPRPVRVAASWAWQPISGSFSRDVSPAEFIAAQSWRSLAGVAAVYSAGSVRRQAQQIAAETARLFLAARDSAITRLVKDKVIIFGQACHLTIADVDGEEGRILFGPERIEGRYNKALNSVQRSALQKYAAQVQKLPTWQHLAEAEGGYAPYFVSLDGGALTVDNELSKAVQPQATLLAIAISLRNELINRLLLYQDSSFDFSAIQKLRFPIVFTGSQSLHLAAPTGGIPEIRDSKIHDGFTHYLQALQLLGRLPDKPAPLFQAADGGSLCADEKNPPG